MILFNYMETNIYVLIDPITEQIRYVGKTNNLKTRLYKHCNNKNETNTQIEVKNVMCLMSIGND